MQRRGSFLKGEQMAFLRHDVGETKPNVVFQVKLQFSPRCNPYLNVKYLLKKYIIVQYKLLPASEFRFTHAHTFFEHSKVSL